MVLPPVEFTVARRPVCQTGARGVNLEVMSTSTRSGRILTIPGAILLAVGTLLYGGILRHAQSAESASPMDTVRALVASAVLANLGGALLLFGLARLRDRVSLRIAGAALAVILVTLDHKALDALLGRVPGYALAGLIGAAFLIGPWFMVRGETAPQGSE